jgi:superfamily II DNA or RNA helicase
MCKSKTIISKYKSILIEKYFNNFDEIDLNALNIKQEIKKKLYDYQQLHVYNLITSLKNNYIAFDGSQTGTGKTYTAIATCKQLNLKPIIVCTNNTRTIWKNICNNFGVEYITITNYELLRKCKEYNNNNEIITSTFLSKNDKKYIWNIKDSKKTIIIFDEVHKCKNTKSQLGKLLISSKHSCKILMLSATLCDKSYDFVIFGYMLGFYTQLSQGIPWINGLLREDIKKIDSKNDSSISEKIFPEKGSRMSYEDVGNKMTQNIISYNCYDISEKDKNKVDEYLKYMKSTNKLVEINNSRYQLELIKVPIIIDEILKYYELGKNVVVFVNFIDSLNKICEKLIKMKISFSTIKGGQTTSQREENIEMFQYNKNKIILCMIQSGGESINLHDTKGTNPRVSIISPSYSSIELLQSLGRIYRSDVKSVCLQKIIFCSDTLEEKICEKLTKKSKFINKISDNDLLFY